MSDEQTPGRDPSGRFIRRAAEAAHNLHTPSADGMHPMAKILFGWTHAKGIGNIIFWVLALLAVIAFAAELAIERHDSLSVSNSTGFYGIWGFVSFSFAVIMGWPLGHLLRRGENYYGDAGGPPADADPDAEGDDVAAPPHGGDA